MNLEQLRRELIEINDLLNSNNEALGSIIEHLKGNKESGEKEGLTPLSNGLLEDLFNIAKVIKTEIKMNQEKIYQVGHVVYDTEPCGVISQSDYPLPAMDKQGWYATMKNS